MKRPAALGFTLVELMFVIALIAIMTTLAVPSFRDFYIRNTTSALGSDFSGAILRARSMASTRNTCVAICRSTTVDDPNRSVMQRCAASNQQNWQSGWLVFVNPSCDASLSVPASGNLIGMVNAANPKLMLKSGSPKADYLMFSPTGYPRASDAGFFTLTYVTTEPVTSNRKICLNAVGNVAIVDIAGACP